MSANNISSTKGTRKVIRLLCITWLITKAICYKLWLADRLFPLVPVHDSMTMLPSMLHTVLLVISLGGMLVLFISPNKKIAALLLMAELLSCLLDQNRWQPWEYQFIFMLAVYLSFKDEKQVRFCWQLIIAGIFFFSGLGKLNSAFIHDVWQNLLLHRWLGIRPVGIWVSRFGYALPLIEMLSALCLLTSKARKPAIWILILMHVIILLMLGPLGLNMNAVIWPWNVLMPLLLIFLFYDDPFEVDRSFFRRPLAWLVMICWWILPWFQLAGYWDKYLSSVLYSGGVEQLFICTNDRAAKQALSNYMDSTFKVIPCEPVLSVYKWGVTEIRTAPYPEKRIYRAIISSWKKKYPNITDRFYLYKPGFSYTVEELFVK